MLKKSLIQYPTKGLSETEWQELRRTFSSRGMVGGSDAGTLLGWNKWKSPISMYYQALGLSILPFKMNLEMLHGKLQEKNIAESWRFFDENEDKFISNVTENIKPRQYRQIKSIIVNPNLPVLFANIDGLITKHPVKGTKKGILEIKKINGMSVDSYVGGLPPQYIAQVQHYLMVCELEYAELCMRVDGHELAVHYLEADRDVQDEILKLAIDFQNRVKSAKDAIEKSGVDTLEEMYQVASEFEPAADASDDFNKFISEKHKLRMEEVNIFGESEQVEWAIAYNNLNKVIKDKESEKQLYMNKIKQFMERQGATTMSLDCGKVTWRKQFLLKLKED